MKLKKRPAYLVRMEEEAEDLTERLLKLHAEIGNDKLPITENDRYMMIAQSAFMESYLKVLSERISSARIKERIFPKGF